MPKEVGEAIERNKKQIEADAAAAAAEENPAVAVDGAKATSEDMRFLLNDLFCWHHKACISHYRS